MQKKLIVLPRIEFHVLYTGKGGQRPDQLTLTDTHFQGIPCGVDLSVRVIRDGREGDIIYQYVGFTRVFDEQMRQHKDNKALAVAETIRICRNRNLLAKFMSEREEEVMTLLNNQFEIEHILKIWRQEEQEEGMEKGIEKNRTQTVKNMLARGYDVDEIAAIAEVSREKVNEIAQANS